MSKNEFTAEENERYSRHFVLPEVGIEGQSKLNAARVLIAGAGGLGSPVALYLAAAGVGTFGIVDHDVVTLSNLQRQILYTTHDVGKGKAVVAKERLLALNPGINIIPHSFRLDSGNAIDIFKGYDIIVDCTDNFPTRYLINDAAVLSNKVSVYGSVYRFEGQVSVFGGSHGPCYRCLYPVPPAPEFVQDCSQAGVLGVLPGIVGALQASETIKLILGKGKNLIGRLLMVDAMNAKTHEIVIRKDPTCPACGEKPGITSLIDYEEFCGSRTSPEETTSAEISVQELKRLLDKMQPVVLLDVREVSEHKICALTEQLIPLRELERRQKELDPTQELIVYCHHGIRSRVATDMLRQSGFRNVRNLTGGIDAWAREIDNSMRRY